MDGEDDVFRTGADAELAAPDAEARGYVVVRPAAAVAAEGALVDVFRNPRNGPNLSVVGVTAELEVDALLLGLLQVVGLVVEEDGEGSRGGFADQFF